MKNTSEHSNLEGKLLLADPSLRGGIFHKSVVLLADHSREEGAMGLILNQPAGHTVGDLLKGNQFSDLRTVQVHIGGPVAKSHLSFAAFWNEHQQFHFEARISAEDAIRYIHKPGAIVRAFVGYSGWDKDQLEEEIEQEAWVPVMTKPALLSTSHDTTLWKTIMAGISPFHYILSKAPDEILSN
ncbi:YqgE/AlgH family protein [Akkermansiaceae bacterium]|nr:YqgE/AlgH family protein [Akkermansiaceae bacterium]